MTEKRFISEDDCYGYYTEIIDNEKELDLSLPNPKKNLTIEELVDLLNDLEQEAKDNEHYHSEVLRLYKAVSEENKRLKKELKKYTDAFDCSQCKFQNYDWFDDGDEFEVCEKGNNEAQMENHSCSEWEEMS